MVLDNLPRSFSTLRFATLISKMDQLIQCWCVLHTGGIVTGGTIRIFGSGSQKKVVQHLLKKFQDTWVSRDNTHAGIQRIGAKNTRS